MLVVQILFMICIMVLGFLWEDLVFVEFLKI